MGRLMEQFREGGWGMFPTMVFGLLLLGVAVQYALRPERRFVPLMLGLGTLTLSSGALGFSMGLITTCRYLSQARPDEALIALTGFGESLNNIAFALVFVVLAAIGASLGALRLARQVEGSAVRG